ncbi:hypothetical protein D3C77_445350 [compost metagenome]
MIRVSNEFSHLIGVFIRREAGNRRRMRLADPNGEPERIAPLSARIFNAITDNETAWRHKYIFAALPLLLYDGQPFGRERTRNVLD